MNKGRADDRSLAQNPYEDLYIYYIQGHLATDVIVEKNRFLGNWEEDDFSFLFFSQPSGDVVGQVLSSQPELALLDEYHMTYDEWLGERPSPLTVGRFFITPPWETVETPANRMRITMDPGVVFGTGTHPTTRDCLEMIETVCETAPIHTAIDVGTGTGLLAVAAARMGCRRVLAYDFNRLAVQTALENIRLNRLTDRVLTFQGRAETFTDLPGDLVIANIHYDVMERLLQLPGFLTGKYFILSGLLRSQAKKVDRLLMDSSVEILETCERDGTWFTFMGKAYRS